MDDPARLIPLLQLAWQAALDPTGWQPLVAQIAETFGGAAAIYSHDPTTNTANIEEFAAFQPEFMRSYAAHYGPTSPWSAAFRQLPVGTLLTRSLVPELTLETTEYYTDWLRPQGLHDALGGILGRSNTTGSYVGVLRAADRGDFPDRDKRNFRALLDALLHATRVHARIQRAAEHERALHAALDRAGLAAFVTAPSGGLTDHNQRAETLLRSGRAIRRRVGGGTRRGPPARRRRAAPGPRCRVRHASGDDGPSAGTRIRPSVPARSGHPDPSGRCAPAGERPRQRSAPPGHHAATRVRPDPGRGPADRGPRRRTQPGRHRRATRHHPRHPAGPASIGDGQDQRAAPGRVDRAGAPCGWT